MPLLKGSNSSRDNKITFATLGDPVREYLETNSSFRGSCTKVVDSLINFRYSCVKIYLNARFV